MRLTRRGRLTVTLTVTALLASGTAYLVTRTSVGTALGVPTTREPCKVQVGERTIEWSPEQAMTATTTAGVGLRRDATPVEVAVAVGQSLRRTGDHPIDATEARSIYRELPEEAKPRPGRVAMARALLGYDGGVLTCTVSSVRLGGLGGGDDGLVRENPGALGLTPRAEQVRREMRLVFGKQILGGFEPQGVAGGHIQGSAHYEGRAIDVFFRPIDVTNQRRGWTQAMWAVAHADSLDVATVIFDAQIWSQARSLWGWRTYEHPEGPTENPILLHRDHVHVDVTEGT